MTRAGDWMQTASSRQFWPLEPRPDEVHIEDIAHALSMQCRFAGHCREFYSVGEHSVRVSYACDPEDALWGLLHDASEAYLVDVPRPIKPYLTGYREIEARVMAAICTRFGLPASMPRSVKIADEILLATEARDLMSAPPADWCLRESPIVERIEPWGHHVAKAEFLARFYELTREVLESIDD
jgi:uncharacterized protein